MEELKTIMAALGSAIAVATFIITRRKDRESIEGRLIRIEGKANDIDSLARLSYVKEVEAELLRRIIGVESHTSSIPSLVTKVDLFWGLVEEAMPRMLMKHNELDRDVLLAKMENKTLQPDEAVQLKALLEVDLVHMEQDDKFKQLVIRFVIKRADLIARKIK